MRSRYDLTFAQLKMYYQERGLELNEKFANSLEFLTPDSMVNYIAYLLTDENGMSINGAKYAGADKVDLIENVTRAKVTNTKYVYLKMWGL